MSPRWPLLHVLNAHSHLFNRQSFSFARDSRWDCSTLPERCLSWKLEHVLGGGGGRTTPLSFFLIIHIIALGAETVFKSCSQHAAHLGLAGSCSDEVPRVQKWVSVVSFLGALGHSFDPVPLREDLSLPVSQFLHFKSEDYNSVLAQCLVPDNCPLCGVCYCHN